MSVSQTSVQSIDELSINTIRTLAMDAVQAANSGHPGAPMGLAPLGHVLYSRVLRHNPANPHWPDRDRFLLSGGHAALLQYSLLHLCGYDLPLEELKRFRQWRSLCPGHPEYRLTPGIEATTGPLGQGFGNAVGFALTEAVLAERFNFYQAEVVNHYTYVTCGDGDMQEGISSEAASLAGNLGLGKLIAIYDDNHVQIEGSTDLAFCEKVAHRFSDYGWSVDELHDDVTCDDIELALENAKGVTDKPSLIVLRTHIGYGSPNKQDTAAAHGAPLGAEEVRATKQRLGWPPDETFLVPDEVRKFYSSVAERGRDANEEWAQRYERYRKDHPEHARQLDRIYNGTAPPLTGTRPPTFSTGTEIATRQASGKAMNWLAETVPELVGGAADLAPSTDTYLDGAGDIGHQHFGARNVHFGVREHGMGAIVNGMTLHGLRAYGATFLAFSDYMREPIRLAALMRIPAVFVFTHDSIGVGQDGPTHQPIEQLAALRAIPGLDVIRPADANETVLAWRYVLQGSNRPTALVLTRQHVEVLDPDRIPHDAIARGAYVYKEAGHSPPQALLIGTGSEVGLCLQAAQALESDGIATRVVSMPSFERFLSQPDTYRDAVLLPDAGVRVSVEMASTQGWERFVSPAASIGLDHFGASAPFPELAYHYGFTAEQVSARVKELFDKQVSSRPKEA
jgi:transketolase